MSDRADAGGRTIAFGRFRASGRRGAGACIRSKAQAGPSSQRPVLNRWIHEGPQAGAMRSTACRLSTTCITSKHSIVAPRVALVPAVRLGFG
jgi:hypothetical protein